MPPPPHKRDVLSRSFEVLEELIRSENQTPVGAREIAKRLDLQPASAHRILTGLEARGLAVRRPGGYGLGVAWWRMASDTMSRMPYGEAAESVLTQITNETGESSVFSLYDRVSGHLIYANAKESEHPIRHVPRFNEWLPVTRGASGLPILAFLPQPERKRLLDRELASEGGVPARRTVELDLEHVRDVGYVVSYGSRVTGARGVGAPVWGEDGMPRGSLMVTAPAARVDDEVIRRWITLIVGGAEVLTMRLGGRTPPGYTFKPPATGRPVAGVGGDRARRR